MLLRNKHLQNYNTVIAKNNANEKTVGCHFQTTRRKNVSLQFYIQKCVFFLIEWEIKTLSGLEKLGKIHHDTSLREMKKPIWGRSDMGRR